MMKTEQKFDLLHLKEVDTKKATHNCKLIKNENLIAKGKN